MNGLDEYEKSLEPYTLEFAAEKTGLSIETLKKLAHMIVEASGVCVLVGDGRDAAQHGLGYVHRDFQSCCLMTGNYMRTGTGAYPLRGHNNVQGASDHGAMPNFCDRVTKKWTIPR